MGLDVGFVLLEEQGLRVLVGTVGTLGTEAVHVICTDLRPDVDPRAVDTQATIAHVVIWTSVHNVLEVAAWLEADHLP